LGNLRRAPNGVNAENILVVLLYRRLGKPLWTPHKPITSILGNIILDRLLQRKLWTIVCAKVAETTATVKVLWIPSLAPWDDRDAFLRTYPRAYPTTSTSI